MPFKVRSGGSGCVSVLVAVVAGEGELTSQLRRFSHD